MALIHPHYLHNSINIIMVSYHRPRDFQLSINSILTHTDSPYYLFIIDNSMGGLDSILAKYENTEHIRIFRNASNIGKAKSVNKYYSHIMHNNQSEYFVCMDSDIIVSKNWLSRFLSASKLSNSIGILAPTIMNRPRQFFNTQISNKKLVMHGSAGIYHFRDELFYNRHIAGPLFFINRSFFERHLFNSSQLYGNDDGDLCKEAYIEGLFTGVLSNVHVIHSRKDENHGYMLWKHQNVHNKHIRKGYWDLNDNLNNTYE